MGATQSQGSAPLDEDDRERIFSSAPAGMLMLNSDRYAPDALAGHSVVATADIERAAAAFADGLPESSTGPCVGTARVPATPNTVQKLTIDDCMARSRGSLRPWKHGRRRPVLTTHAPALRTAVRHMPEMSEAGLLQHAWPLRVPSGSRWHALRPRVHQRTCAAANQHRRVSAGLRGACGRRCT